MKRYSRATGWRSVFPKAELAYGDEWQLWLPPVINPLPSENTTGPLVGRRIGMSGLDPKERLLSTRPRTRRSGGRWQQNKIHVDCQYMGGGFGSKFVWTSGHHRRGPRQTPAGPSS